MTRTLILVRHAKSAWPTDAPDDARPLAARGLRDAPAVGRWLHARSYKIDLVVCSPAVRAAQTWDLAAVQLDALPRVRHDERLYNASAQDLLAVIQQLPRSASTAVLVGHNPGLEDILTVLAGLIEPLKTSAIAVITTPLSWERSGPGSWTAETLATPRG